jgi:hypothetical protein
MIPKSVQRFSEKIIIADRARFITRKRLCEDQ